MVPFRIHSSVSPSKLLLALLSAACLSAANPELLTKPWSARWISVPGATRTEFGVYHFRRTLTLEAKPSSFVVHVSGDNRYQLYVNGTRVSEGPARGDLYHWRYETVDLAPHLNSGRNVLAAVVWNFGPEAPLAQVTNETGFLLQGDTAAERIADTGKDWKSAINAAYTPIPVRMGRDVTGYYVAGPGERVDAAKFPWGWETAGFDDAGWPAARVVEQAAPRGANDAHSYWMLVAREIPAMEESPEPPLRVRVDDGAVVNDSALSTPFTVPAGGKRTLVLDQGYYTTGFPELVVSGGRGATVSLRYAESLFQPGGWVKGNRNEVAGKHFMGYQDIFLPDGGARRTWRPLWWRTWRYIELSVENGGEPLTVNSLTANFSGYPFVQKARLSTSDAKANAELQRMLDVSWRTLRVDAHETFMDCAYYEQLQYLGDGRLEALTSMTLSSDPRLVVNAIRTLQDTQTADGLSILAWTLATLPIHPTVLVVLDRHGARLLDVPGRSGAGTRDAAGGARHPGLVRGAAETERIAQGDAVVELRGLGPQVAGRRASDGQGRIVFDTGFVVAGGLSVAGGSGAATGFACAGYRV